MHTRSVIILWRGLTWRYAKVNVATGLDKDLPPTAEFESEDVHGSYRFVLVGMIEGTPVYRQK